MEFCVLTEKEFTNFAKNHPYGSFHQNVAWGHLKEMYGWKMHLVGVKEKKKIVAASLILAKMTPIKKNIFYAPRGFLLDYNNSDILNFFIENLKEYLKKNKAIFVKFDPYVEYQERDLYGNIVEGGYNNQEIVDKLTSLGIKHHGFSLLMEDMQPRWIFTLDTKGKTIDELMNNMDSKTRQILRKNERMGMYMEELSLDNIEEFYKVMEETASRREFVDRSLEYYKRMFEEFSKKDEIMIYLAKFNHDKYIKKLNDDIKNLKDEIKKRNSDYEKNPKKMNVDKLNKKNKASEEEIKRLETNVDNMKKSKKENGNIINLGSILFFKSNNEVLSLYGGSYEKFMKFQSAYSTHFAGIKYAVENGYDRYNFYGITGDFNEDNPLYGLYSFKRDFGGKVIELIGEFDLIINKFDYVLYNVAFGLYHGLKKVKSKLKK